MGSTAILLLYFLLLCGLLLVSCLNTDSSIRTRVINVVNMLATTALSIYALFTDSFTLGEYISIERPKLICLGIVGLLVVSIASHRGHQSREDARVNLICSFLLFISYVLMGVRDWISIFLCYKAYAITLYPLISAQRDGPMDISFKGAFHLSIFDGALLAIAIYLYSIATNSFFIVDVSVVNQGAFALFLIFMTIFLGSTLGLFPFNIWMDRIFLSNKAEDTLVITVFRKVVFAYLISMLLSSFLNLCDDNYREMVTTVVKYYVVANIVLCGLLLMIERKMTDIISITLSMSMSLVLLSVSLFSVKGIESYVLFYIVCTVVPFIGSNLLLSSLSGTGQEHGPTSVVGLFKNHLHITVILTVFALSITAFPLTAGFSSRYLIYLELFRNRYEVVVLAFALVSLVPMTSMFGVFRSIFSDVGTDGVVANTNITRIVVYCILASVALLGGVLPHLFVGKF